MTISDLTLLLENETTKHYIETIGNSSQSYSEEAHGPQEIINSFQMPIENNYHNPQTEYFEMRNPQGINLDYHY